jgi:hypothetical protein
MFGLSIPKLLVLALIIGAVWYGFKWLELKSKGGTEKIDDGNEDAQLDLVQCPVCDSYGPRNLAECPDGRDDCPMIK